jgi:small ligand-binding sensory domain FIST
LLAFWTSVFRVESVVDAGCRPVGDYANVVDRGQKDVMQNADTRLRLAGHLYELGLNGGSQVRVGFIEIAP